MSMSRTNQNKNLIFDRNSANEITSNDRYKTIPLLINELLPNSPLTESQILQFKEKGYFIVKNILSAEEINEFVTHFKKICMGEIHTEAVIMKDVVLAKRMKLEGRTTIKDESQVTKIQNFEQDQVLMKYPCNENIIEYVKPIVGKNIRSMHTMLINKPPDLGKGTSEHPMHQDLLYFPIRPSNRIVAAWTALQDINKENGGLCIVPGTHKLPLFPHCNPARENNTAYQGVQEDILSAILRDAKFEKVWLDINAGDTVFFHPLLIHGSGPNYSNRFRKAISCHFASGVCEFLSKLSSHNYDVIQETVLMGSRKLGTKFVQAISSLSNEAQLQLYCNYFKSKSKLITGIDHVNWVIDELELGKMNKLILEKLNDSKL